MNSSIDGVPVGPRRKLPQVEFDALLDHIYENGTTAEGVNELALALCEAYARGVNASDPSGPVITDLPDTGELETCPSGATNNVHATGVRATVEASDETKGEKQ